MIVPFQGARFLLPSDTTLPTADIYKSFVSFRRDGTVKGQESRRILFHSVDFPICTSAGALIEVDS